MTFINPIDILQLGQDEASDITPTLIKRAKKRIYADIELSDDGVYHYKGKSFSKSDIDHAINQLDDHDKLEYYLFINKYQDLQNFLYSQDDRLINNFRNEAIFLHPGFIEFISPYFAASFNILIYKTYLSGELVFFKKATSVKLLTVPRDITKAYQNLTQYLTETKKDLDKVVADLRNKTSIHTVDTIKNVYSQYKFKLSSPKLNCLPILFQDQRNAIANSFRNFSVNIYNFFDDAQLSMDVIKYALTFEVNGLDKQELEKDLIEITKLFNEREESIIFEEIIKKYADLLKEGDALNQRINNKTANGTTAVSWVNANIPFSELNSLPDSLTEINSQLALLIRSLSVSVWNKWEDIDNAIRLIDKSLVIKTTDLKVKQNLNEAKSKLSELKSDLNKVTTVNAIHRAPITSRPVTVPSPKPYTSTNNKTSQKDNSGCAIFIIIIIVIAIIIAIANGQKNSSTAVSTAADSVMTDSSATILDSSKTSVVTPPAPVSQWAGNSLKTGASPYNSCFGIGSWNGNAWIKFTNDNSVDAIICLVDSLSNSTIRNEYIRAGAVFKMKQIPAGMYYIKVYSGNDWNPGLQNGCGNTGAFEKSPNYSSSIGVYNAIEITDDGVQYSTYKIDLSKIINSNPAIPYNESSFFNNQQTQ
ncbi:hypothetical protein DIU31_006275 [Mucilaginibacter rubeus]|uniref:Uncharacterized protein n=1 Tax=Mucilaginibacter rubeus TaxID=2027860 RepID=A0AAE6JCI6_9SPHI|nr:MULTISPECIES: hypothetical protein [Mucilaginibacter]QEM03147.1 hypothetical protein DIU31_006275 [Mucilaginibacter rubeus]QEM15766.1 hypothetical protein DIU38_006350 [Mucilaginibacter gossypii]QTE41494.1 hypothetical protein J3L19_21425 [Mucilaginibacter rubeus]QTE48099.1 hypothetical protein J3L21_21420 [Mucilaginibacter rubeus]QTE59491.1 hypothetical protein J3L23_13075 [Mucilaginibacter rubeus]